MINFIVFIYNYYDWQKPNSTEEKVFLDLLNFKNDYNFNYIAYPWATYVDKYNSLKKKNISFSDFVKNDQDNINFPNNNLNITCFQSYHIYKFIDDFKKMNINIIFSPHCEIDKVKNIYLHYEILILPIFLIPIISPNSNYNLLNNKIIDKSTIPNDFDLDYFKKNNDFEYNIKKYFISFVGTINYNNNNELSEFRVKCLETLKKLNNVYIFETDKWHLNDLIYSVMNRNKEIDKINRELNYYQNMLYSKYVLCPKGIGPNSFRISESIKFNNIPIIISDKLMLPKVNDLEFSDYSITLKENELFKLTNLSLSENKLKTLNSNINIVNNYLNNLANPILDFFDEKFNLLIVFFKISNTSERYKEYEYVLKKNINDINIKKIHIFFEFNDYYNEKEILNTYKILNNKKIKIIPTKKKYVREISFNELFDYANNNLFGEKIIISNNDIYFENLNKIKKNILILKKMILAITRTNYFNKYDNHFKIWKKHDLSQDSWIFVSPIIIPKQIIYIGWQGCDNRIAFELNKNYNLSNPTDENICYHYQKYNNFNDYINLSHHGDGLVLNVPFTKLNEICKNYNLNFMNHFIKRKNFLKKKLFKLFIYSDILNNCEYINSNYYQLNEYEKFIKEFNEFDNKKIILSDIKINILNSIIITKNIDLHKELLEKYINIYLTYNYNHIEKLLTKDLLCIKTKFINDILKNNNINQINISNGVFKNIKLPKLSNEYDINAPILFFGMYFSKDFLKFKKHIGKKYIVWCDKDCDINNKLRIKLINKIKNDISRSYYYCDNCKNNLDFLEINSERIKL